MVVVRVVVVVVAELEMAVRGRKSIESWYPGYQTNSNLEANIGRAEGSASHHLRVNSQLLAWPVTKVQ